MRRGAIVRFRVSSASARRQATTRRRPANDTPAAGGWRPCAQAASAAPAAAHALETVCRTRRRRRRGLAVDSRAAVARDRAALAHERAEDRVAARRGDVGARGAQATEVRTEGPHLPRVRVPRAHQLERVAARPRARPPTHWGEVGRAPADATRNTTPARGTAATSPCPHRWRRRGSCRSSAGRYSGRAYRRCVAESARRASACTRPCVSSGACADQLEFCGAPSS